MKETSFPLFEVIRSACTTPVWSQGARLARTDGIHGVSESSEEVVIRVHVPGLLVAPTVVLYPEDDDWECDCPSRDDTCAHVAAAAIAVERARGDGRRLPTSKIEETRVLYKFESDHRGLLLDRFVMTPDGTEHRLTMPLMSQVQNRSFPHGLRPSQEDLGVDQIVGRGVRVNRPLARRQLKGILRLLEGNSNVLLNGSEVKTSSEPILPVVRVCDGPEGGISVHIESPLDQIEVVAPGIALVGPTLHEIGAQDLGGKQLEKVQRTLTFAESELAEFATNVLPDLESRARVTLKTSRLPDVSRFLTPRIVMQMEQRNETLLVLPKVVYGTPPVVRIEGDKMVYLRGSIPIRDKSLETDLVHRLRAEMNLVPDRRATFTGKDAAYFVERLREWGTDALDSTQQVIVNRGVLAPKVEIRDDILQVTFVLEVDNADEDGIGREQSRFADATTVISAWQEGLGVAPLNGGGFGPIPAGWLDAHGHLVADLLAVQREDGRISTGAIPMLRELSDDLEMPRQPCFDRLAPLLGDFTSIPKSDLPDDLTGTLRGYQKEGVDWLRFLRHVGLGAILADDMGLGKTLEALCTVEGRTLVVCPTSVLHNWTSEIERFRPGLKWSLFHGANRTLCPDADIIVTSYAILRIDRELFYNEQWDSIIIDEAQNIKNPDSQVARAAYGLRGNFHLALSGTPVENRLEELWSLFHFCNPGLLGSRTHFRRRFGEPIGLGDETATEHLGRRIRPFVLRRLKRDVARELPPRTDQILRVELDAEEQNLYGAVRAATSKEVVDGLKKGGNIMAALEALLRLRQVCCHRALLPGQEAESSAKIELLLERLDTALAGDHKCLVFSQWTSFLDKIEPHLRLANIEFARLDGTTKNRGKVVEEFQSDSGPPVMLISLKAGGTGLNLTRADHVFIMDPWWNPAVEDQAADRTHRIGQDRPVMVYHLLAKDTVEEGILALQEKKRKLADAALGKAGGAVSLTREDLLVLLE